MRRNIMKKKKNGMKCSAKNLYSRDDCHDCNFTDEIFLKKNKKRYYIFK